MIKLLVTFWLVNSPLQIQYVEEFATMEECYVALFAQKWPYPNVRWHTAVAKCEEKK